MPPMKIQPIDIPVDSQKLKDAVVRNDAAKPVLKSRLRRLFVFDRQSPSVLKTASAEKSIAGEAPNQKDGGGGVSEFEPSSVCLAKMVQNFIEESNEKQPPAQKCGRNRCNCFNGNSNDSSDEEFDLFGTFGESNSGGSFSDATDVLKSLILCASVAERNLLADTAKIVEDNKVHKRKDDLRKIVTEGLSLLGYDCSICKSKWDKTPSCPAGEYEYIDVIVESERLFIDIDFRSEFEIARSTGTYKAILQLLPQIFVGKSDRLSQIISIISEAAKQSLKKKGMHFPPWRKAEYMRAKWLSSPYTRTNQPPSSSSTVPSDVVSESQTSQKGDVIGDGDDDSATAEDDCGELELIFGEKTSLPDPELEDGPGDETVKPAVVVTASPSWQLPAIKPKSIEKGTKVVTGLASLLKEKPSV
ncbi:uncharacterized protein LOC129320925 [Prosopis cineraria]|uniref:uncharacterized protein LOC129320925 n=1 Tax=Prosopis cineraria TaxID=364024 RepID=UPI00241086D8|nr:uncharacterized protein LOC129320925 [Prosopis cineraria]